MFSFQPGLKNFLFALGLIITFRGAAYFWKKFRKRSIEPVKSHDSEEQINECLFFSPQLRHCKNRRATEFTGPCGLLACSFCSYQRIIYYLNNTEHHLDICQYNLTIEEICGIIVKLFKTPKNGRKGVFVRIITDKQMSEEAAGTKVVCFRKEHIPIKVIRCSQIMHNKFVIIDQKIVITGSCNWTMQGMSGNLENLIVTSNKDIAKSYLNYFDYIWENSTEFSKF